MLKNRSQIRNKLALAYQMCEHLGLSDLTYTHLSARGEDVSTFYIYPFGLLFDEVTPENLLTVDFKGHVLEGEEAQYNRTGYVIHGSIYPHRPDVQAIFHLHTPSIVAVSSFKEGLLPMSQWALHFYEQIQYHDYNSLALDIQTEGNRLVDDLKDKKILMMRHHGVLIAGSSIQECLFYAYHLEKACYTQCLMGIHSTLTPCSIKPSVAKKSYNDLMSFEVDLGTRDFAALARSLNKSLV
jgi:ribulose-5-phosphate 4-epimerase/fuculose-1-phosphate aldolase